MAEGLHDDAIARRAGLSTTTVRRHIAAIMKRLDVTSRFAAGPRLSGADGSGRQPLWHLDLSGRGVHRGRSASVR